MQVMESVPEEKKLVDQFEGLTMASGPKKSPGLTDYSGDDVDMELVAKRDKADAERTETLMKKQAAEEAKKREMQTKGEKEFAQWTE